MIGGTQLSTTAIRPADSLSTDEPAATDTNSASTSNPISISMIARARVASDGSADDMSRQTPEFTTMRAASDGVPLAKSFAIGAATTQALGDGNLHFGVTSVDTGYNSGDVARRETITVSAAVPMAVPAVRARPTPLSTSAGEASPSSNAPLSARIHEVPGGTESDCGTEEDADSSIAGQMTAERGTAVSGQSGAIDHDDDDNDVDQEDDFLIAATGGLELDDHGVRPRRSFDSGLRTGARSAQHRTAFGVSSTALDADSAGDLQSARGRGGASGLHISRAAVSGRHASAPRQRNADAQERDRSAGNVELRGVIGGFVVTARGGGTTAVGSSIQPMLARSLDSDAGLRAARPPPRRPPRGATSSSLTTSNAISSSLAALHGARPGLMDSLRQSHAAGGILFEEEDEDDDEDEELSDGADDD